MLLLCSCVQSQRAANVLKHQRGSSLSLHTTGKVSCWVLLSSSESLLGSLVVERWFRLLFLDGWTVPSFGSILENSAVVLHVQLTNLKSDF